MPFSPTFGRRTNRCSRRWGVAACTALVCLAALDMNAQEARTQTPNTAPQVEQVLSSYEGQKVGAIEIAGRPDVNASELQPLLAQKAGEPFAKSKIDQSIAVLKSGGKAKDVELDIRPQPDGIRVMFVLRDLCDGCDFHAATGDRRGISTEPESVAERCAKPERRVFI